MSTAELCKAFIDRHVRDAAGCGSKREIREAREFIEGQINYDPELNFYKAWEGIGIEEQMIKPIIADFILIGYNRNSNLFKIITGVLE